MDRNAWSSFFNPSNLEENFNYSSQNPNLPPPNANIPQQNFNFRPPNHYFNPNAQVNPMHVPGANPYMMYPPDCYQYPSYPPFMPSPPGFSFGSPPQILSKSTRIIGKDGGSTPSSEQGSSPPGIESINLESDFDAEAEPNVTQQRRKRWSPKENDVLARCWASVSEDSVVGTDQKVDQFWIKIEKEYNKNRPANTTTRHWEAMKMHFYTAQRSVTALNAEYIAVKQRWASGHNDQDILMETLKMWEHNHNGQSFKLLGMWQILKDCPKWNNQGERDYHGKKKMKTSISGAYTSSSNNDDDDEERVRPMGQKMAKNKEKGKGKAKGGKVILNDIQSLISDRMERYERIQEKKIDELKKQNRLTEYLILREDTSGMDSTTLEAHNIMVADIKKRWGIQ